MLNRVAKVVYRATPSRPVNAAATTTATFVMQPIPSPHVEHADPTTPQCPPPAPCAAAHHHTSSTNWVEQQQMMMLNEEVHHSTARVDDTYMPTAQPYSASSAMTSKNSAIGGRLASPVPAKSPLAKLCGNDKELTAMVAEIVIRSQVRQSLTVGAATSKWAPPGLRSEESVAKTAASTATKGTAVAPKRRSGGSVFPQWSTVAVVTTDFATMTPEACHALVGECVLEPAGLKLKQFLQLPTHQRSRLLRKIVLPRTCQKEMIERRKLSRSKKV